MARNNTQAENSPFDCRYFPGGKYICSFDGGWVMREADSAFLSLCACQSSEGLLGSSVPSFVHPDDREAYLAFFLKTVLNPGSVESLSYRLVTEDGFIRQVLDTMHSALISDGGVAGYSVVCEAPQASGDSFKRPEDSFESLLSFSENVFDVLLRIDLPKRSMTCTKNAISGKFDVPLNLPLYAPDAFSLWASSYVLERDRADVSEFASLDTLSLNEIRHSNFRVGKGNNHYVLDALLLSHHEEAVLLLKLQDDLAEDEESIETGSHAGVFIRTFGHFDVFVNGEPIFFKNAKAKEYLALLVDRRGGYVSSREAVMRLWEDSSIDETTLARARKAAMHLNATLREYGIQGIIENNASSRRVNPQAFRCDLMEYLKGGENHHLFKGSYMREYSWAEETLGELTFNFIHDAAESM